MLHLQLLVRVPEPGSVAEEVGLLEGVLELGQRLHLFELVDNLVILVDGLSVFLDNAEFHIQLVHQPVPAPVAEGVGILFDGSLDHLQLLGGELVEGLLEVVEGELVLEVVEKLGGMELGEEVFGDLGGMPGLVRLVLGFVFLGLLLFGLWLGNLNLLLSLGSLGGFFLVFILGTFPFEGDGLFLGFFLLSLFVFLGLGFSLGFGLGLLLLLLDNGSLLLLFFGFGLLSFGFLSLGFLSFGLHDLDFFLLNDNFHVGSGGLFNSNHFVVSFSFR